MKHLLAEMSFLEFAEAIKGAPPLILIPLGSQEEQGPGAPMGDFMLTELLAGRIAAKTGSIAAPTIPFGHADYFRTMPGGIQLRATTFRALLRDVIDSFLDHGLDRLLVFNGHSGNAPLIDEVSRTLRAERRVIVPWVNIWRMIPPAVWQAAHGENAAKAQGHGADPMTSVYLHLLPGLVRGDLFQAPAPGGTMLGMPTAGLASGKLGGLEVNLPLAVTDHCANGIVSGDPRLATAEAGERFAEHIVATTSRLVEHLKTQSFTVQE